MDDAEAEAEADRRWKMEGYSMMVVRRQLNKNGNIKNIVYCAKHVSRFLNEETRPHAFQRYFNCCNIDVVYIYVYVGI